MFERFTDKARAAVILAKARDAERDDQIRPVYILHALASGEGVAARALASLGVDADAVERQLARTAPLGNPLEGEAASEYDQGTREYGWHSHVRGQLFCVESGLVHVRTARGSWLLPPQRAWTVRKL